MQDSKRRTIPTVEELEPRALLAGFFPGFGGGGGGFPGTLSPAVQADLANLQTDQQRFRTDFNSLLPTIRADQQAIQTAIQSAINNNPAVQAARTTLTQDQMTWRTTLQGDWQAIASATDPSVRSAAITKLFQDWSSAGQALQTDSMKLQTAFNTDPGVQAAQMKLQSDTTQLITDQAMLQVDFLKLQTDLQGTAA